MPLNAKKPLHTNKSGALLAKTDFPISHFQPIENGDGGHHWHSLQPISWLLWRHMSGTNFIFYFYYYLLYFNKSENYFFTFNINLIIISKYLIYQNIKKNIKIVVVQWDYKYFGERESTCILYDVKRRPPKLSWSNSTDDRHLCVWGIPNYYSHFSVINWKFLLLNLPFLFLNLLFILKFEIF